MNEMNPKVSIVIPVYNAEKYIDDCINSIINQPFQSYEIILVNDGSVDKSKEICLDYAEKYNNICLIDKENGGPSSARNMGIENAVGEYIVFIDADDIIHKNYFTKLYSTVEENHCDMVISGYESNFNNKTIPEFKSNTVLSGKDLILSNKKVHTNNDLCFCWRCIYRLSPIKKNNIRFNEGVRVGEDTIFNLEVLLKSRRAMQIDEILYTHVIDNYESIMSIKYKPYLEESILNQYQDRKILSEEYGLLKKDWYSYNMAYYYSNSIYNMLKSNIEAKQSQNIRDDIKRIVNYEMFRWAYKVLSIKNINNTYKEYIYYLALKFKIYPLLYYIYGI